MLAGAAEQAQGQTYQTWRDEATSGSWQGSTNWWNFPNGSPIVFGQQQWANNHFTEQTNENGGSTLSTWRWLFQAGASAPHTVSGDAVQFFDFGTQDPAIINESSATHVIGMNITGDGDAADPLAIQIDNSGGGGLTFNGTVSTGASSIVNVTGSAATAATVTFNGAVGGTGGMFVNNSNLTVVFNAANTISGQLTLNAGTVQLGGTGDTFGSSSQAIRVGLGATVDLNDVATTVGSIGEEGDADAGIIDLGSATLTVSGNATTYQSTVQGTGGINHTGTGILNLFGSQTYSGTTTVSAGTIATSGAMGSATYSVTGSGTFSTSTGNLLSDTATVTVAGGTFSIGGNDSVGTFTISGGSLTGAGTLTAATYNISGGTVAANLGAGTYNISGTPTITGSTAATGMTVATGGVLDLATSGDFSTVISGDGGVAKTGSTSLTLSGNNSYAGSTAIDAGTLLFNGTNTGNGTVTVATAAAIGGTGSIAGSLTMAAGSKFSFNQAGGLSVGGTVSFTDPANFGVDDIIGLSSATPDGLYTLFGGTVTTAGLANLGSGNAHDLGSGKSAYFVQGSLQVQVVPEPGSFMIIGAGLALASLRRLTSKRRAA